MSNKNSKKIIVSAIIFAILTILMVISYILFKDLNNQLCSDISSFTLEGSLLGKNDDVISKANLYYNLAVASKYIGFCSFGILIILFVYSIFKKQKR